MNDIDIKEIRKLAGISQKNFAKITGVHLRTVQNWEKGGVIPDSKYAILRKVESDLKSPAISDSHPKSEPASPTIDSLLAIIAEKDRQIDRLLSLLEKK